MHFEKIHACGNDFLLLTETPNRLQIKSLCDQHHGLGADGIMVFHNTPNGLRLEHFDPDGTSSFCLNGTRSAIGCLYQQGLIPQRGMFFVGDRQIPYQMGDSPILFLEKSICTEKTVATSQGPVSGYYVHVGNPHFLMIDKEEPFFRRVAKEIRHSSQFPNGANVHLVKQEENGFQILHFERGVEDYTLSCGSGSLAAACFFSQKDRLETMTFFPLGGDQIEFQVKGPILAMHGPVRWVASGDWRL